jgi:hypothetical protein
MAVASLCGLHVIMASGVGVCAVTTAKLSWIYDKKVVKEVSLVLLDEGPSDVG